MWTAEHSIETTAAAEAIWRLWADVPRWPDWIADIAHIEISGPFAAGSTILMTPIGQQISGDFPQTLAALVGRAQGDRRTPPVNTRSV
jgi:uncharacterized membrane protein